MEEFSEEDIEKYSKIAAERVVAAQEANRKQKDLEDKILAGEFPLKNINWHCKMEDVDFSVLRDFSGWENKKYEIIYLPTDTVAHLYISNSNKKFPKNKLFGIRQDIKIIKLVDHLLSGEKVIPPVLRYVGGKYPIMFDQGNHRFALARFLNLESIPFIIEKCDIDKISSLCFPPDI